MTIETNWIIIQRFSTTAITISHILRSQRVRHPMVVIIQRSLAGCPENPMRPLYGILRGYLQAAILIGTTYLFGSTYGGDLIYSLIFVCVFLTLIVVSRTYSIYLCLWLEKALDATVIEYDTPSELQAIRTVISGMPGVLVKSVTEGYIYSEGFRLDRYNGCPHHDEPRKFTTNPRPLGFLLTLWGIITSILLLTITLLFRAGVSVYIGDPALYLIVLDVSLGIFVYGKIISDLDFIDYHGVGPRPNDADPEVASRD